MGRVTKLMCEFLIGQNRAKKFSIALWCVLVFWCYFQICVWWPRSTYVCPRSHDRGVLVFLGVNVLSLCYFVFHSYLIKSRRSRTAIVLFSILIAFQRKQINAVTDGEGSISVGSFLSLINKSAEGKWSQPTKTSILSHLANDVSVYATQSWSFGMWRQNSCCANRWLFGWSHPPVDSAAFPLLLTYVNILWIAAWVSLPVLVPVLAGVMMRTGGLCCWFMVLGNRCSGYGMHVVAYA